MLHWSSLTNCVIYYSNIRAMLHVKARSCPYPSSHQKRAPVPDEKVPWNVDYPEYDPPEYTAPVVVKGPAWADPHITSGSNSPIKFNKLDGLVNRVSFTGLYQLKNNVPLNPCGRTGLEGRGLLGKWGPNHAADPIVTRWLRNKGDIVKDGESAKPILQFVAICRRDTGEWAVPGGMVDAGEQVSVTLKREFGEEALNTLECSKEEKENLEKQIRELFSKGKVIYEGYVDDPRNTDNAWMETVAVNFHDEEDVSVSKLPLHAGDDAGSVRWMNISSAVKLYASHLTFLKKVVELRNAHW